MADPDLTEAQYQELLRRLALYEANPTDVVPWEEVEAQALKRIGPHAYCSLSEEQLAELLRRLDAADADDNPGSPWDEVKARLLRQL